MTLKGFDTWGMGPTAAQAKAARFDFRTWYSSYDVTKDGPGDGPALYAAEGIWSFTNFETTIDRVLSGGYAGGQADMAHAVAEFAPRGMPVGAAVALSADEAIDPSLFPKALAYYQGSLAEAVTLGGFLNGAYGEQSLLAYLKARDAIAVGWRTTSTAWPGGASTAYCDIIQTGGATVGGASVDLNEALVPYFGQWMPGQLAGADMPLTPADIAAVAAAVKDQITNVQRGVVASPHSGGGQSTIGSEILALPARFDSLNATLASLGAKVGALAAPVDVKALAAALAATLGPALATAAQAGVQLTADQLTVTLEQHIGAALTANAANAAKG
jgi:hypothetical protein